MWEGRANGRKGCAELEKLPRHVLPTQTCNGPAFTAGSAPEGLLRRHFAGAVLYGDLCQIMTLTILSDCMSVQLVYSRYL